ncbi:uncharacterized protein FIBRA_07273 [Fibroporia radiculosa]|uniref:FCP1 homology domain-containing protein n=1 Tax=Fibroporia radiculosa TaxID=599839 RepID=J4I0E8_9APHY|nr:uncharacterized protein FIBRA_07273 [Fibroporia radiculosa]CCM05067.1 predicted protein [Fibroporia radiculosa]
MAAANSLDHPSTQVVDHSPSYHRIHTHFLSLKNPKGRQAVEGGLTVSQPAEGTQYQSSNEKTETSNDPNTLKTSPSATANGSVAAPGDVPRSDGTVGTGQAPNTLVPSAQATHAETSHTATTSTSLGKDSTDAVDKYKENDKDKGSLDTTLGTRAQSFHRKDVKSVSEGAHTASSTAEQPSTARSKTKRARRSFFVKFMHVLVPCVGSSQSDHFDESKIVSPLPTSEGSLPMHREKPAAKEGKDLPPTPPPVQEPLSSAPTEVPAQSTPEEAVSVPQQAALSLQPLIVPTQVEEPSEQDIVIPPTPTRSLLPQDETEGMTSGAVQPPGSTGDEIMHEHSRARESGDESDGSTSFTEDEELDDGGPIDDIEDEEERLIMNGGAGIPTGPDGTPRPLLPLISPKHVGRKCLVLDLDETLVHSSFKSIQQADYVVPVEIEYHWHNVYVIKRPGVDNFLKRMGEIYEVVVFTASLSKYADPVLDKLDIHHVVSHRLFRESCYNHRGNYVKDLSQLGRPISDTIIIDNSPASYIFHPNNAVPVSSWFNDPHDTELTDLCPFLADLAQVDDVRGVLDGGL